MLHAPFFIERHLQVFPEGQFCAEVDGLIVGSATSLIVSLQSEYQNHSWSDIVGNSTSHNGKGDSLYADDILTHPSYRRQGIGTALMNARKELCLKIGLRRIIGGARLYNYCLYAEHMSPQKYTQLVINKKLIDPYCPLTLKTDSSILKFFQTILQIGIR